MAKKRLAAIVKIQIPAGQATPAPPVGTALGPHGVAIMDFCKMYNAQTENQRGTIVPVEITVFEDRTFSFILKTPPTPVLLRQAGGRGTGAPAPGGGGGGGGGASTRGHRRRGVRASALSPTRRSPRSRR